MIKLIHYHTTLYILSLLSFNQNNRNDSKHRLRWWQKEEGKKRDKTGKKTIILRGDKK
jgi:hypothetical protein